MENLLGSPKGRTKAAFGGKLLDKLKFDCRNDVTEPSERVTNTAALCTHCPWGHPHKLKFISLVA